MSRLAIKPESSNNLSLAEVEFFWQVLDLVKSEAPAKIMHSALDHKNGLSNLAITAVVSNGERRQLSGKFRYTGQFSGYLVVGDQVAKDSTPEIGLVRFGAELTPQLVADKILDIIGR